MTTHDHTNLAAEIRAFIDGVADRAEPLLRQFCEQSQQLPATCHWCPVCAAIAVLRGENPELAVRAAEQGISLLDLVRNVLGGVPVDRPGPNSWTASGTLPQEEVAAQQRAPTTSPRVQRIAVRRVESARDGDPHWPDGEQSDRGSGAQGPAGRVERITIRRRNQET